MKLKIIRIENHIVTGILDDGVSIDIAKRWFSENVKVGDEIEVDATIENKVKKINT